MKSHPPYSRLIQEALSTPWCITEEMKDVIFDILRFRAAGGRLTAEEIRARVGEEGPRPQARTEGVVAVIPIYGVIAHRTFEASSGMTSTDRIAADFRHALADDAVGTILFDVASPGGVATGIAELGDEIRAGRSKKRIIAFANGLAASAAYWLASQASEFYALPSADVGSIGVYSLHEDWSGWLEKEGVKITATKFGKNKIEGAPWEPLNDETKAHYQARVDEIGRQFQTAVAKGRGVSVERVREQFGDGRMFGAKEALARGMVDGLKTLPALIAELTGKRRGARAAAAADTGLDPGATPEATPPVAGACPHGTAPEARCELCVAAEIVADVDAADAAIAMAARR